MQSGTQRTFFTRAQGSAEQRGGAQLFELSGETLMQHCHKENRLFEKIEQVLLSSTGTEVLNCKYCIFKAFTPTSFLNARSSYMFFWHLMFQENMPHSSYSAVERQVGQR